MISFNEAKDIVKQNSALIKNVEQIALYESLNRILAQDIVSDIDMPPFDKSAMDGYACRRDDINKELKIVGVIRAGNNEKFEVQEGECVKIMTGGKMPVGADCVLAVEDTKENDGKIVFIAKETKSNFVKRAYDIKKGDVVLRKGSLIKPQQIAVMASVGILKPLVYQQLKVAVLTTGDEIVEPHIVPVDSQIRNSNASQLLAQIRRTGALPLYMGIVGDGKDITKQAISEGIQLADVLLITGGVSMGDYDFVPDILIELGVDIKFDKVAVKPGKPTVFGLAESCFVFGLPGNPVSSFIIFETIAKELIYRAMGYDCVSNEIETKISEDFNRRSTSRTEWVPVKVNIDGTVSATVYHGSAHIHALCSADAIMRIEKGVKSIPKGEKVYVRFI
ncbi:MAG: molybdopterin molybdotransferase MoeA [Bacteroidales bacterium]|nr:molybdopterin molybdotransferase MoeA [Bacteroidales bacterium]MDD4234624.1 molybdopterin molybdotransferase MoeA [Bacteroidales bacterium]